MVPTKGKKLGSGGSGREDELRMRRRRRWRRRDAQRETKMSSHMSIFLCSLILFFYFPLCISVGIYRTVDTCVAISSYLVCNKFFFFKDFVHKLFS